jgi:hypothetical protein
MDWEKVFSLFGSDESGSNYQPEEEFDSFRNTPLYKIKMFMKLILNGIGFKKQILSFFKKSNNEFNEDEIDKAGDYMMYVRAFYWVSKLDIPELDKDELKYVDLDDLQFCISSSISYFEGGEDYEKCAVLKKLQDFLEEE